jgi:glycosyltransferase involved in cell wall biosynthesis
VKPIGQDLALFVAMVRAQSWEAGRDRVLDRVQDRIRERMFEREEPRTRLTAVHTRPPPVLNVSPLPPFPRRGGAQIQLFDRLEAVAETHAVALVYPVSTTCWRLEWRDGPKRIRVDLDAPEDSPEVIHTAAGMIGADVIHLENTVAGDPAFAGRLASRRHRLIVSTHDYSVYCRRPHLIESPAGRFCGFSTNDARCLACLRQSWRVTADEPARHRSEAAGSLEAAEVVVFPSGVARDHVLRALGDRAMRVRTAVIPPATTAAIPTPIDRRRRLPDAPHVGFVGGLHSHKGAHLIGPTVAALRRQLPTVVATVYGDGDHDWARRLRDEPAIRIRGYYRAGRLTRLVARGAVDVVVFPSVWPETYGLVVDECLLAGVPVVAFDIGAVPDRLAGHAGVTCVALEAGGDGLARACLEVMRSGARVPPESRPTYTVRDAARRHLELYRQLGVAGAE